MTCTKCGGTGVEPDHRAIGKALRSRRKAAGLSMRELGQKIGVSHSFLSQLETGRRSWTPAVKARYEQALRP